MTTLLSLRAEYEKINIIIAIVINVIVVYAVLKSSSRIERALGANGLGVIRKAFGVILLAIAVKLFAANVKGLLVNRYFYKFTPIKFLKYSWATIYTDQLYFIILDNKQPYENLYFHLSAFGISFNCFQHHFT